ncbi:hypothetical protein BCD64_11340 [Nostoc sp. MBR 210]|nr:hypothetical protein BCD64_11340 [Nostoc sp. MBR 210]
MDRTQYQSYEPWKLGIFPKGQCDLQSLVDEYSGLKINLIFHDSNQTITVKFESTKVYRVIDEGYRLKQLQHLPLPMEETMYVVSNSDMVEELVDEACGMVNRSNVVHYFIVTDNDCIDVIVASDVAPQLEYQ